MTKIENHAEHSGVLVVVCSALFFGVLNGSAAAVVLPEIGAEFDASSSDLSWVMSGFLLVYGVAIPFYGRLASRFGARRLFLFGLAVFSTGSILAAVSININSLLVARTIQAIGGAAVPGLGMTLASNAYPENRRGFVLGIISATMGVGAAVGPLAAGVLADLASWRLLFGVSALTLVNVPIGMYLLDRNESLDSKPLDLGGGVLFGIVIASALFALAEGSQKGWIEATTLIGASIATLSLIGFTIHQRNTENAFIPHSLLQNRSFVILTLLGFGVSFANLAAQIGYPFLFNELHDLTTLDIGLVLIPAAVTTAVAGVIAGRLVDDIGASTPLRIGLVTMIISTLAISTLVGHSIWFIVALTVGFALGFAMVNTPLAASISLMVEKNELASALSLNTMMFFIGGSFGATLFMSVVSSTDPGSLAANPIHSGPGFEFSNAFAMLVIPLLIGLPLSRVLLRNKEATFSESEKNVNDRPLDCHIPWAGRDYSEQSER